MDNEPMDIWEYIKAAKSGKWLSTPNKGTWAKPDEADALAYSLWSNQVVYNATSASVPPLKLDDLLKLKKQWLAKMEGSQEKKITLGPGPPFEFIAPKPKDDFKGFYDMAWQDIASSFFSECGAITTGQPWWSGFGKKPSVSVVKTPSGYVLSVKLEEHLAYLRSENEADFEEGLRDLRAASAVWNR